MQFYFFAISLKTLFHNGTESISDTLKLLSFAGILMMSVTIGTVE
jgi:hypothetical protein